MSRAQLPRFDFQEARNTAVFVCQRVAEGSPILRVAHDEDGDWQFLCGGDHQQGDDQPQLWCLEEVVQRDSSVNELARMSVNHHADRDSSTSPWRTIDDAEAFIEG